MQTEGGVKFILLVCAVICMGSVDGSELSMDYYNYSCPDLEGIVKDCLLPIFISNPQSPAALLRLLFHDCQVQGCDASILLDSDSNTGITSEMISGKNFGVKNRETISAIKSVVEDFCPRQVSCADILALAAREAVAFAGGPRIAILLGRKDSVTASSWHADKELPPANLGVDGALSIFMAMGMSVEETVAILGSHTIGVAHCINIVQRLYNTMERHENIDRSFELLLRLKCPTAVPITNATFVANDFTNFLFDNQYYRDVLGGRGLLTVDSAITVDPRTIPIVSRFAQDEADFFQV